MTSAGSAAVALLRCAELATISSRPDALERVHLTPEHARANGVVAGWMRDAGMRPWQDAAGNQCGRLEGRAEGLPALVLGSHLDTVPDAGWYDGPLGVVMALAVVERLRGTARLPFAVEVVAFGDEEGTRFGTALLGSRALAGTWDDDWWELRDPDGTSLHQAFRAFGLDPARVHEAGRRPGELVGYLEAHIEQGPQLETADVSLGYVTNIAGACRFTITVHGEARHAGGTPYSRRRDALAGASEIIAAVERSARSTGDSGCIATVGRVESWPGAVNVIPGRTEITLDLRAESDMFRDAMWELMRADAESICARRGLRLAVTMTHCAPASACAPWLQRAVADGIRATGDPAPLGMWSRAGHDAMAMAAITDTGMLFVRCLDGISHHPAESVREIDVARGIDALEHAVLSIARSVEESSAP